MFSYLQNNSNLLVHSIQTSMQNLAGGGGEGGEELLISKQLYSPNLFCETMKFGQYKYSMLLYHPNPELLVIIVNSWRFVKK